MYSSILQCSKIGDHPQENLAHFGYRPYMKVKFKILVIFLEPVVKIQWILAFQSNPLYGLNFVIVVIVQKS